MSAISSEEVRRRLRTPVLVFLVLLGLLAGESAVGVLAPRWWPLEFAMAASMVTLVIGFSMEMRRHQPIVRLYSVVGFFWVAILFGMISLDYLTR